MNHAQIEAFLQDRRQCPDCGRLAVLFSDFDQNTGRAIGYKCSHCNWRFTMNEALELIGVIPDLVDACEGLVNNACAGADVLPDGTHRVDCTKQEWQRHAAATRKAYDVLAQVKGEAR